MHAGRAREKKEETHPLYFTYTRRRKKKEKEKRAISSACRPAQKGKTVCIPNTKKRSRDTRLSPEDGKKREKGEEEAFATSAQYRRKRGARFRPGILTYFRGKEGTSDFNATSIRGEGEK